jgi:hypothetical protein
MMRPTQATFTTIAINATASNVVVSAATKLTRFNTGGDIQRARFSIAVVFRLLLHVLFD